MLLFSSLPGLNELVPENLLAIFDENELEVIAASLSSSTFTSPPRWQMKCFLDLGKSQNVSSLSTLNICNLHSSCCLVSWAPHFLTAVSFLSAAYVWYWRYQCLWLQGTCCSGRRIVALPWEGKWKGFSFLLVETSYPKYSRRQISWLEFRFSEGQTEKFRGQVGLRTLWDNVSP